MRSMLAHRHVIAKSLTAACALTLAASLTGCIQAPEAEVCEAMMDESEIGVQLGQAILTGGDSETHARTLDTVNAKIEFLERVQPTPEYEESWATHLSYLKAASKRHSADDWSWVGPTPEETAAGKHIQELYKFCLGEGYSR